MDVISAAHFRLDAHLPDGLDDLRTIRDRILLAPHGIDAVFFSQRAWKILGTPAVTPFPQEHAELWKGVVIPWSDDRRHPDDIWTISSPLNNAILAFGLSIIDRFSRRKWTPDDMAARYVAFLGYLRLLSPTNDRTASFRPLAWNDDQTGFAQPLRFVGLSPEALAC